MANNWYTSLALARTQVERPRVIAPPIIINDVTADIVINAQANGYNLQLIGANPNRVYLLVQNNTHINIALAIGNGPNAQGMLILPGGYYERQFNCFIASVYVTILAASSANDYITYEEGSSVQQ